MIAIKAKVQTGKRSSGRGATAEPGHEAVDLTLLLQSKEHPLTTEQFCEELARIFRVQVTEVALLRLEGNALRFVFPPELQSVGSIPLSSSAVAAHTAATKRGDLFNSFAKVKHASVFEVVKLHQAEGDAQSQVSPIQKLMSAPVLDAKGKVLGVVQISRKGAESCLAGPDFTRDDLQQLERAAQLAGELKLLRETADP